ncbi:MAG: cobyrinate a,c-diamide synthase, partial [Atribacterota bacterium]
MATGIVIAATHSGAGKTTVTLGILRALSKRIEVEPFKVGPDYIDPAFHQYACRKPSHNLDYYLLGEEKLRQLFFEKASPSGLSVVEGVMGLYDGINTTSDGSTAQVAKILHLPVLLVVEAGSLGASVSAMILGYVHYDPQVHIAGVIFNRVGNARHYELLKCCVERDVGIPVVGYLPVDLSIQFPERHLGLVPSGETEQLEERLERLSSRVERTVDLDVILQIAQQAGRITSVSSTPSFIPLPTDLTIAIASDNAFNFYYPDGLEVFQRCGARLLSFSPLHDTALPPGTDGLILGGGFPEVFARELSEKVTMKHSLRRAIQDGLPTYAECGGLMYLTEEIIDSKG